MISGVQSVIHSGDLPMLKLSVVTWATVVPYKLLLEDVSNAAYEVTICSYVNVKFVAFGQGFGPIHRTQVLCQGFEPNIFLCPAQLDTSSCTHAMDAGVICISKLLI